MIKQLEGTYSETKGNLIKFKMDKGGTILIESDNRSLNIKFDDTAFFNLKSLLNVSDKKSSDSHSTIAKAIQDQFKRIVIVFEGSGWT